MSQSKFVYVTYIKTTPEKVWQAFTTTEFVKKYWFNMQFDGDLHADKSWKLLFSDGQVADTGEVIEFNPPKRLVLRWQNEFKPELKSEGNSQCEIDIEKVDEAVKLTITHMMNVPDSKFIEAVSNGWPIVLSNLKSLLETGMIVVTKQ